MGHNDHLMTSGYGREEDREMPETHTPGPWMIHPETDGSFYVAQESGPAYVARSLTEANARLIAASPALLEALSSMMKHYAPQALDCAEWALSGNTQTDAILRQARSALRAAAGVTP